ncbi:M4 family metallopeptidase [Ideonella sp. 4Y11]|uniref:Neutral metalloproteinase n=1 Tax=Ideonella aquatica TaxID=2824119 RepID=A0A940YNA1_9BURK|nr:M4 family metallopeptidase [Ideonella aquatica]MBQ0960022.1 M4 family metallopeptidase [Ideonella aquatica]
MTPRFALRRLSLALAALVGLSGTALAAPDASHPAVQRALQHLGGGAMGLASVSLDDSYVAKDVVVDADGTEHVRLDRLYKGLPVIAGDLIVRSEPGGQLHGVIQTLQRPLALNTTPSLSADRAAARALKGFKHLNGQVGERRLVVYARGDVPHLAWDVAVEGVQRDGTPSQARLIVHADSGKVVDQWDTVHTKAYVGTGKTLYSGDVVLNTKGNKAGTKFELKDLTRGKQYTVTMNNGTGVESVITDTDNIWGTNLKTNPQSAAADAQYGMAVTWDYYLNVHGRKGVDGAGTPARSRVHYASAYNNAFWSDGCYCMTYGDGSGSYPGFNPLVSLDVAGHEMTHGVTSRTAGLIYSGESGGLNEATSDIFGSMVEYYAANANDAGDYLIGEEISIAPRAYLRTMIQPSADGSSSDCWYSGVGNIDVHYSSGVANHFFFLLAEGTTNGVPSKTCTSGTRVATGTGTVAGIGRAKAEKIWYRALTTKFTSGTTFANARTHTIAAANELYGTGSAESNAVAAAWSAVNRN